MKRCHICAKGSLMGGGYSNRVRATKFNPTGMIRKYPNLQKIDGLLICTRCLKKNRHLVG